MKPDEFKKIREMMENLRRLREFQKTVKMVNDINRQRKAARQFLEENKELLRKEMKPEDLELLRETCGYDKKAWEDILRELRN